MARAPLSKAASAGLARKMGLKRKGGVLQFKSGAQYKRYAREANKMARAAGRGPARGTAGAHLKSMGISTE